jgi:hypothetical protein
VPSGALFLPPDNGEIPCWTGKSICPFADTYYWSVAYDKIPIRIAGNFIAARREPNAAGRESGTVADKTAICAAAFAQPSGGHLPVLATLYASILTPRWRGIRG